MPGSIAIDTRKYAIYVKVIGGLAGGPLIWIDAHGHIHHGPDPRPLDQAGQLALRQIEDGVAQLSKTLEKTAAGLQKSAIGA
jgi:hypothetical protein